MTRKQELYHRLANYALGLFLAMLVLLFGYMAAKTATIKHHQLQQLQPESLGTNPKALSTSGRFTIVSYSSPEEAVHGINQMFLDGFVRKECHVWREQLTCIFYNP